MEASGSETKVKKELQQKGENGEEVTGTSQETMGGEFRDEQMWK